MAEKIKVMISSRCKDEFMLGGRMQPLSEVRKQIKQMVESEQLFGQKSFTCWINDDPTTPAGDGSQSSWDYCMKQVSRADIVIALYNGRAGWTRMGGSNGICYAELEAAMTTGGAKLRVLNLAERSSKYASRENASDKRYKKFMEEHNPFWGGKTASNGEELLEAVRLALVDAVQELVRLAAREARKAKYDTGEALQWSNMDFRARKAAIENVMRDFMLDSFKSVNPRGSKRLVCTIGKRTVLARYHAIPDGLSVSAARELVGQPQLLDHEAVAELATDAFGPIHFIGCFHGITETQAKSVLGCPDITTVKTSFGVYASDNINKVQIAFISNCRDSTATRSGLDKFFAWTRSASQEEALGQRAESRCRIIKAIASERATR